MLKYRKHYLQLQYFQGCGLKKKKRKDLQCTHVE